MLRPSHNGKLSTPHTWSAIALMDDSACRAVGGLHQGLRRRHADGGHPAQGAAVHRVPPDDPRAARRTGRTNTRPLARAPRLPRPQARVCAGHPRIGPGRHPRHALSIPVNAEDHRIEGLLVKHSASLWLMWLELRPGLVPSIRLAALSFEYVSDRSSEVKVLQRWACMHHASINGRSCAPRKSTMITLLRESSKEPTCSLFA